ncbi:uncharacterized protein SPPG_00987 [Spizellomyces punctatus DAOM BR117]|uniref:SPX domain-containing protein n=1 Tax=Spizellomyces punctatus (strain DAOM BR117) TaxID=645134 RepID=A0A0L0HR07_SPIPD|nr:uncharacterized protein SPPG_00987 [Spizellomyces punctatus DAOM BR117]KND03503.1 hypothetical protein SPPG_00987 [Spizellomyces punctatus DAOM BR117]|eukprot:XP_016611542.1 hypothetical protein SPPG_00987 [Spizellomyces punctatus DAOM BR117]
MKFGKYIQAQQTDWAGPQYLNYKGLKKIINSLQSSNDPHATFTTLAANNPPGVSFGVADDKHSEEYQALKTAFFFKLERELEKVNAFYLQKEADLKVRLRSLIDKKRIWQSGKSRQVSASLPTLKEGFLQFQRDLTKLQKFVEVNATGFRKILKKWDKRSKSSTKELYLSRQIEIQPCFNNDVLAELTDQATTHLAELENLLSKEDVDPIANIREAVTGETHGDVESELTGALKANNVLGVQEFLSKRSRDVRATGQGVEDREILSRSFLRFCVESNTECLDVLFATGEVDCNFVDDISGRTSLHETSIAGRQEVMRECVRHGANVEATDVYGRTALHYAAMYGRPDCALYLLSSGAKVHAIDHDGCTPLIYSITGGHTKCVEILIDHGAVVEPHSATAPIPLNLACQHGQKDIAMLLLSKGARLTANSEGLFPLHLTSREGHFDISQMLINHGADVNAPDNLNGWTPIFYAASEGHLECAKVLLKAGCRINIKDESNWLPWTYALYRGHIRVARLLELQGVESPISQELVLAQDVGIKPMAPSGLFSEESNPEDMDIDALPDLSLPPPIIPFRIYGHAFLDKKHYIQVTFRNTQAGSQKSPISLFGSQPLSSLKMVISSKPEVGIPYSVILPLQDDLEVYTFLVEDLANFSLQFDVFPTFGTKPIGRGVVLPSQLAMTILKSWNGAGESEPCICPLFDSHLRVVGELSFDFAVVKPFAHPSLSIGGKVETYWKTTKVVGGNKTEGVHSFITASSLAEEYIQVIVQLTKDGVPVIYPKWHLPLKDVDLGVSNVSFSQARALFNRAKGSGGAADIHSPTSTVSIDTMLSPTYALSQSQRLPTGDLAKLVYDSFFSLRELLMTLPPSVGVSIVLKYPTSSERSVCNLTNLPDINTFVDAVLQIVYDQVAHRSIIFMSFNPSICTAINWKQPNYGVFFGTRCGFGMDGIDLEDTKTGISSPLRSTQDERTETVETDMRCTSIKEAIRFAKSSNLLGVVCEATPLVQVPILINTIKESGLILATCGSANDSPPNVRIQEEHGADAIIVNNVFRYNVT